MGELFKNHQRIRFSGSGASHQNLVAEHAIKTVVTMQINTLIHDALRCPDDTLSTYIWPTAMGYAVWFYNRIPYIQSGLSAIEIWSRSRFEPVSENFSNFHVWGCPTYFLDQKWHNTGLEIPKWDPRSRRGVNMIFREMHSTQFLFGYKPVDWFNLTTVSCCIL